MKQFLVLTGLICILIFASASNLNAQDGPKGIVKFSPAGVIVNTLKGPVTFNNYAIRIGGEYAFTESVSFNFSFDIAFPDFGRSFIYIRPEARYYVTGTAPTGVYVGGFFQYGNLASSVHHIGVGASAGWQEAFVKDHLVVDLNLQLGYGGIFAGGGSANGLLLFPNASIGYGF